MKKIALFVITALIAQFSLAQSTFRQQMYAAYLSGKYAGFLNIADSLKKLPHSPETSLELGECYFSLLKATMVTQDENTFDQYVDAAEEALEKASKNPATKGEALAMLSGVNGLKIAYSPMMGMFLGPKSSGQAEKAMKADPASEMVWFQQGNSLLNTPEMWGGDPQAAVSAFAKAKLILEQKEMTAQNNRYLETLAWLGLAYRKVGEPEKARQVYEAALAIEPNFLWVKKVLLPQVGS